MHTGHLPTKSEGLLLVSVLHRVLLLLLLLPVEVLGRAYEVEKLDEAVVSPWIDRTPE